MPVIIIYLTSQPRTNPMFTEIYAEMLVAIGSSLINCICGQCVLNRIRLRSHIMRMRNNQ